ncbi:MAG: hypothetical protein V5A72_00665 [Candidatus Nanohaloarchaea archaeon]
MEFQAVILSEIGDYLLEEEEQYNWTNRGLELERPYVVNEEGLAQRVKAKKLVITDKALQGIQKGSFDEETVE